jgi:hypothetical protein
MPETKKNYIKLVRYIQRKSKMHELANYMHVAQITVTLITQKAYHVTAHDKENIWCKKQGAN